MITDRFEVPSRLKSTGIVLLLIGVAALIAGYFTMLPGGEHHEQARFWTVLLQNSVFFLFISAASIFIQAAAGLAQGGWIVAYRRVPEAIGANVWLFGAIATVVMFLIAFTFRIHTPEGHEINPIYRWMTPIDPHTGHADKIAQG